MVIYLDESGDLGFEFNKTSPSKKFVITLLVCQDHATIQKFKSAVRRTLKNKLNQRKNNRRIIMELKGTGTTLAIKKYFYSHVPKREWSLYAVSLDKMKVYHHLQTKLGKKKLYNYIARFLIDRVDLKDPGHAVTLIVDKCKNKDEITDFNQYIGNHNRPVKIKRK